MNKLAINNGSIDIMNLGQVLSQSGYFQDARDAAQAVVKVLAGQELGFGPVASMTGINIIKGKVSLSANLMAAAIKRSGRYTFRLAKGHPTDAECTIEFFERSGDKWESLGSSTFTAEDAKRAGLGGDNWRKYPRNMLYARAMSNGVKWYCPDISGSPLYTPDELGADIDGETGEVLGYEPDMPMIESDDIGQPETPPTPPKQVVTTVNLETDERKEAIENKPFKFATTAQETFYSQVQEATGHGYDSPYQLFAFLGGGDWKKGGFNYGDENLWDQKLDLATSHIREKREKEAVAA